MECKACLLQGAPGPRSLPGSEVGNGAQPLLQSGVLLLIQPQGWRWHRLAGSEARTGHKPFPSTVPPLKHLAMFRGLSPFPQGRWLGT